MIEEKTQGEHKAQDLTFLKKKLESLRVLYTEKSNEYNKVDEEIEILKEQLEQIVLRSNSIVSQMNGINAKIKIYNTIDGVIEIDEITNACYKLSSNSYFKTRGLKNSTSVNSSIVIEVLSMDGDMKNCQIKKECVGINTLSEKIKKGEHISNNKYDDIKNRILANF